VTDELALKRARWRAEHRGTKEADMLVGGFAARYLDAMAADEFAWFDRLLHEQDVDILAWAFGQADAPEAFQGPMLERLRALDYIDLPRR
jgi:antitoxin CptB